VKFRPPISPVGNLQLSEDWNFTMSCLSTHVVAVYHSLHRVKSGILTEQRVSKVR